MDNTLNNLMVGLRISDESFNEILFESDEENENELILDKEKKDEDDDPFIKNWISKTMRKNTFEIILAILRCHFRNEKVNF